MDQRRNVSNGHGVRRHLSRTCIVGGAALALIGCAQVQTAKRETVERGRQVIDSVFSDSIFGTCELPTVGAIKRRFGDNEELMLAWKNFCDLVNATKTPSL